ncbi:MAG: hypothetical protein LBG61_07320 [Burkholderiales bacterium]|jgi:4-hydroxybenzoate polyprenyltransferase|nr:hypothetical protein [Burkholderiales bacterium]
MSIGIKWKERLDAYEHFLGLRRPFHGILMVCPTLSALWLIAEGRPPLSLIVILTMATLLAAAGGAAMCVWARRIKDAQQHYPSADHSIIFPWETFFLGMIAFAMGGVFLYLTSFTALLAYGLCLILFGVFLRVCFIVSPHMLLMSFPYGVLLSLGVPLTYCAVALDKIGWLTWALMAAHVFMVIACEISNVLTEPKALSDIKRQRYCEAIQENPRSVALIGAGYDVYFLGMAAIGYFQHFGVVYWVAFAVGAVFAILAYRSASHKNQHNPLIMPYHYWISLSLLIGMIADYAVTAHAFLDIYR